MWVKEHQPDIYKKTYKVILPKDYIRYKLTGEIATESTDASSTLAFDTGLRKWSGHVIRLAGLDYEKYPVCGEPTQIAGYVTASAAEETGLSAGTPVVFGGADQPMQALGNGLTRQGQITSTIGTGGQIFAPLDKALKNSALNTHTFCNVLPGTWYLMGAILNAGLSLKWLKNNILSGRDYRALDEGANNIPAGSGGVIFLPYLTGERTPHLNPQARAMFFGLTLEHNHF